MKAKSVLMIFVIIMMAVIFFTGCGTVTGPDPPPPPPPPPDDKYYDLQVEYIRPAILNPDATSFIPAVSLFISDGSHVTIFLTRVDDYHFKCEFSHIKAGLGSYYFHQIDQARYDGSGDYSSWMVGDIYIITVKQTGIAKELKDVRPYTLSTNPYPGPKAKVTFFQLTAEGVIISNSQ